LESQISDVAPIAALNIEAESFHPDSKSVENTDISRESLCPTDQIYTRSLIDYCDVYSRPYAIAWFSTSDVTIVTVKILFDAISLIGNSPNGGVEAGQCRKDGS
jgi:hypothetical protein